VPLPLAHALVGASIATALISQNARQRRAKVLACALLGIAPDLDFFFPWVLGLEPEWHRSFMHSIPVAAVVGTGVWLLWDRDAWRELCGYSLAMLSHGILDTISSYEALGVALLWPFTSTRFALRVTQLLELELSWGGVLRQTLREALIFSPILFVTIFAAGRGRRRRERA
jgi:membrane-bound metal-dependent hydrolase YbcI (DUF457 family)